MNTNESFKELGLAFVASVLAFGAHAAPTDISTAPLSTYSAPSSTDVKPNLLFVLDDSGSMDWTYMPDQVGIYSTTRYLYKNGSFNGVAYNPAITYKKPGYFNADGTVNTTTYPSMTGTSAATGADASAKPNWKAVPTDGYGVQSASVADLTNAAYAYVTIPGEYCTSPSLRTCTTTSAPSGIYTYPAKLRWCSDAGLTTCRATYDSSSYSYPRMPSPRTATITVSGAVNTSVSSIKVNGLEILSATTATSATPTSLATAIKSGINSCSNSISGQCTTVGYTASSSGGVVTIFAPDAISYIPTVTASAGMSVTPTGFTTGSVPGENLRTTITSSITSYPYPGSSAKAATRTDCAGTTCTYNEEMINYANWWAYYQTRMQMMKTAASNAFSSIDSATDVANNVSRFRVGYLSINNNTANDFLNLDEFKTVQKSSWFSKLFAANPNNSTPLREALSTAGQLYAGRLNGTTLNGSTVIDPLQFSCQQNYTILSTDGYWNASSGYKLDGTTGMDNQDVSLPPPYNDGGVANIQEKTSSLQSQTSQLLASTSTLQSSTATLMSSTGTLQGTVSRVLMKCNDTTANCGTAPATGLPGVGSGTAAWSVVTSCTNGSGTNSPRCSRVAPSPTLVRNVVSKCNTGGSINSSSPYTATNTDNGYLYSSCSYSWSAATPAGACTYNVAASPNNTTIVSATQCSYSAWSAATPAASCTYQNKTSSTTNGTVYTAAPEQCSYSAWTTPSAAASCTTATQTSATTNGTVYATAPVACSYSAYSAWTNTSSCTVLAQSASSPYTVGTSTRCQYTPWTSWTTVTSCTPLAQSASPTYTVGTASQCQTLISGGTSNTLSDVAAYYYGKDLRSPTATGADATGTCTGPIIAPATTANDLCANNVPPNGLDVATTQHMTTFTLGLGAQGQMVYSPTYQSDLSGDFHDIKVGTTASPSTGICSWMTSGQTCTWSVPSSNSINNIDDLWHAAVNGRGTYYSATDPVSLASGLSSTLATIVNTPRPGTAAAAASSNPNISTSDNFVFSSSYKSVEWYGELVRQQIDTSGNLSAVEWSAMALLDCGTSAWTATTSYAAGSVYRNGSTCYVVTTAYVSGATFGGTDTGNAAVITAPVTLWTPATSYTAGSFFNFSNVCYSVATSYVSGATFGATDATNTTVAGSSCGSPVVPQTTRTLYTKGASGLIPFTWSDLVAESLSSYFTAPAISYVSPSVGLSQFCTVGSCLSASAQSNNTIATGGAAGEALVNFLRGDRSNEVTFYRQRTHVLGDIVSSEGRYVKAPLFGYSDTNYDAFKTSMATRGGKVYVAANDGMLHAFDATTGQESWAYIPGAVLPDIYKLADKNYSSQHQYFVDNSPETGDICPNAPASNCTAGQWKTILVGGLNRGGKGYFALDITNPASPSLLWEFTDTNLGYTYGNPRITKLKDGTWVVLFASGYNNADGVGRLYVVNANTGALIRTISTGVGSAASPSGLARISAHAPSATTDNTTIAAYGGDLLGNLWRFDINGDIPPSGYDAHLLVSLKDSSGNPQPITAKPTVATINGKPVVFVGTGRYLGISDLTNTQVETFYAVKDNSDGTTFSNPRAALSGFVQQTLSSGLCPATAPTSVCTPGQNVRTGTSNAVAWNTDNGWYLDFLTGGERSTTDPALALGTLLFTTNVPNNGSASACGATTPDSSASYVYYLDYLTGGPVVNTAGVAGASLGNVISTRPIIVMLADGSVRALVRTSGGTSSGGAAGGAGGSGGTAGGVDMGGGKNLTPPVKPSSGFTRRVSWRELVDE